MRLTRYVFRVLLATALFAGGCGDVPPSEVAAAEAAIVGGWAASEEDIYATVEIRRRGARRGFCTGTRIAPQVVVTAAHCVVEDAKEDNDNALAVVQPQRLVVAGGHLGTNGARNAEVVPVREVLVHPEYNHAFVLGRTRSGAGKGGIGVPNDIGLLVLDVPMVSVDIAPVFPSQSRGIAALVKAIGFVAGYGMYSLESKESGLLFITDALIDHIGQRELLTSRVDELGDSCFGDSGGPLYVRDGGVDYLVGLVSRGRTDVSRDCGDGGVYTFVPFYDSWMADAVKSLYTGADQAGEPGVASAALTSGTLDGGCSVSGTVPHGDVLLVLFSVLLVRVRRLR